MMLFHPADLGIFSFQSRPVLIKHDDSFFLACSLENFDTSGYYKKNGAKPQLVVPGCMQQVEPSSAHKALWGHVEWSHITHLQAGLVQPADFFAPHLKAAQHPGNRVHLMALQLAFYTRQLPIVFLIELTAKESAAYQRDYGLVGLKDMDLESFIHNEHTHIKHVYDASVPLREARQSRLHTFRSPHGLFTHHSVVIGSVDPDQPVLVRLHSKCFTGDTLGSLRCDCHDQLHDAIEQMNVAENGGIILYLDHEGRSIGIFNKMRSYCLQDKNYNTFAADRMLGFDSDLRCFNSVKPMLEHLHVKHIIAMTNNPQKLAYLKACGLSPHGRIKMHGYENEFNQKYLKDKDAAGHLIYSDEPKETKE